MSESIPERQKRIARDHNVSFKEALRVALAESRLEKAKAELLAAVPEVWVDPEPYVTVYANTGHPPFSRHAWGGNGTAYLPRTREQFVQEESPEGNTK